MSKENPKFQDMIKKADAFFTKVGTLTKTQRLLICLVTFSMIAGGYYYFIYKPKNDELSRLEKIYQSELTRLRDYKKRASEIIKYEKLMAEAQEEFNEKMKALPDKRELPSLLAGISKAGSFSGLAFHLFQPGNEVNKPFYKEIPISIKVEGQYHKITDFFYQIVNLNRIVNINDVSVKTKNKDDTLEMSCKAVTYMFVEEVESKADNKRNRKKK